MGSNPIWEHKQPTHYEAVAKLETGDYVYWGGSPVAQYENEVK
jgi:hypothetical protein